MMTPLTGIILIVVCLAVAYFLLAPDDDGEDEIAQHWPWGGRQQALKDIEDWQSRLITRLEKGEITPTEFHEELAQINAMRVRYG